MIDQISLPDLITLGLIGLMVVIGLLLLRRTGTLVPGQEQSRQQEALREGLVRLETRMGDLVGASDTREQALRLEFARNREEISKALTALSDTVRRLGADQTAQQQQFRDKLDEKMRELRAENAAKLDDMRKTVDEKLQTTLERRLTESFKTVAERLESVQKGLGEMQTLATGVGDLKRVLTNVKSRGTFGEVQLELLIQDILTSDQYIANYDCGRTTGERVEFGIRLPGTEEPVFLPVDAKFPTEDYERLLGAVELGDAAGIDAAAKALEIRIRKFAKDIADKYINPPATADTAILFVPTEGLYAEILRRPGLFEALQRDFRVTVAGPTNFQALLSTIRLGFRQAALAERAGEVWTVLGAVKKEFEKYGRQIEQMGKSLSAVQNHVDKLETRKRAMLRALKGVESVSEGDADRLLENRANEDDRDDDTDGHNGDHKDDG